MPLEKQVEDLGKRLLKIEKAIVAKKDLSLNPTFVMKVLNEHQKKLESVDLSSNAGAEWMAKFKKLEAQFEIASSAKSASKMEARIDSLDRQIAKNEEAMKIFFTDHDFLREMNAEHEKLKKTIAKEIEVVRKRQADAEKRFAEKFTASNQGAKGGISSEEFDKRIRQEADKRASLERELAELKKLVETRFVQAEAKTKAAMDLATNAMNLVGNIVNNSVGPLNGQIAELRKSVEALSKRKDK